MWAPTRRNISRTTRMTTEQFWIKSIFRSILEEEELKAFNIQTRKRSSTY